MIRSYSRAAIILFTLFSTLGSFIILLNATAQAQPIDNSPTRQSNLSPVEFPIITEPRQQDWVGISGDCIAFRNDRIVAGGVYLYNLSTLSSLILKPLLRIQAPKTGRLPPSTPKVAKYVFV